MATLLIVLLFLLAFIATIVILGFAVVATIFNAVANQEVEEEFL